MSLFLIFISRVSLRYWLDVRKLSANWIESQQAAARRCISEGAHALKENRLEDALRNSRPRNASIRRTRAFAIFAEYCSSKWARIAEAAAEYQEAIRLDPLLEDAYRNLGFLRWTERQLAPAREALQHAVKLSPDDSFAHYYLGRVELDAQQYAPAFHELEISRQPLPAEPDFLIQAATGYVALGRREDARKVPRATDEFALERRAIRRRCFPAPFHPRKHFGN